MDVDKLYTDAGKLVAVEDDQISLTKHSKLLRDDVAIILAQVLEENPLPFQLADFQKLAIHSIGNLQNVILIREASKQTTGYQTSGTPPSIFEILDNLCCKPEHN
jgi:hypothetical protein